MSRFRIALSIIHQAHQQASGRCCQGSCPVFCVGVLHVSDRQDSQAGVLPAEGLLLQVWTSKTSDIVRCLLNREAVPGSHWQRGRMQPSVPAPLPSACAEEAATFEVCLRLHCLPCRLLLLSVVWHRRERYHSKSNHWCLRVCMVAVKVPLQANSLPIGVCQCVT